MQTNVRTICSSDFYKVFIFYKAYWQPYIFRLSLEKCFDNEQHIWNCPWFVNPFDCPFSTVSYYANASLPMNLKHDEKNDYKYHQNAQIFFQLPDLEYCHSMF